MTEKKCPVKDWTTDYDIFDPDYVKNPYPIWKNLQNFCPISRSERWGGSWMATKFSDIQKMVRMVPELSSRAPAVVPLPPEMVEEAIAEVKKYGITENPPITVDPPDHKAYKQLILPFFTPNAVSKYRDYTEQLCNELIEKFLHKGEADAAVNYAQQIPPRVIARMLGIDVRRTNEFTEWTQGFLELGQTNPSLRAKNRRLIREYFATLVRKRRANPSDDMLSKLVNSRIDNELLADHTIIGICLLLLVAGIDTTWSSIGSALWHLGGNPSDRKRLASEPKLFPTAIEELLRYYAPVMMARKVTAPLEIGNVKLSPGDKVILNFPAANHDAEMFDRPDEVLLDREHNRHAAFGLGIHRCAGSNLARMEMEVALKVWVKRIPDFELSRPDEVIWAGGQVRGPRNIPIRFPVKGST